ncbi:MAG: hypothetical protein ACKN97_09590 [Acidobacteriota bacterium]
MANQKESLRQEPNSVYPTKPASRWIHRLETGIALLGGVGVGLTLMYLFDPDRGRRRRAIIRDKANGLTNDVRDAIGKEARDLRNRAVGKIHESRKRVFRGEESEVAEKDSSTRPAIL